MLDKKWIATRQGYTFPTQVSVASEAKMWMSTYFNFVGSNTESRIA